ncbi:winged helix-turn-helix domain-containing protein [Candidatus Protofrankia californiensis]|uniref:winged helix-turn-helix domain-containing protein n=1 Tax=Candidatus Protofrankia californiensis TaxID=1839754 RepID=UPI001041B979|nr:DUF2637 domain-containing protein [Candidatus Protofrankia californiensis]
MAGGVPRRLGRALDAGLWLVAGLVAVYSLANVHTAARGHGTADPQAWLLAPIVDIALFVAITADAALSRHGERPDGWATGLRWFCGIATWTLNVWDAAASGDPGAIVAHSIPPVVLVLLAEAAPRYRQRFAALTTVPTSTPPAVAAPEPSPTVALEPAVPEPSVVVAPEPSTAVVPVPRPTGPRRGTGTTIGPRDTGGTGGTGGARGTGRRDLARKLAAVPADDPRSDRQLAADLAAAVGLSPTTARRYITELRQSGVPA